MRTTAAGQPVADVCRAYGDRGRGHGWTSAWDSIRLLTRAMGRVLEMFLLGLPVSGQRFGAHSCVLSNGSRSCPSQTKLARHSQKKRSMLMVSTAIEN